MKVLYIGDNLSRIKSGPDIVNHRNINFLQDISNIQLDFIPLAAHMSIWNKLTLWCGNINPAIQTEILNRLTKESYDYVFFSQSLMGRVAYQIKKKFPQIKIVCCYHNIEKQYAREFLRVAGWSHLPFYLGARYNERLMIQSADINIVLNERDATLMKQEYKRSADLILPVAYEDRFDEEKCQKIYLETNHSEPLYLFVGSAFFANIDGIRWFIQNVMPYIRGNLIIVGKGMDSYKEEFSSERIKVMGYVEDLSELYYMATAAVFPIFSGGGMKTKTAEALMYGRTIIGTPETFEGYQITPGSMYCCHTAEAFINTLNCISINDMSTHPFNSKSREVFLKEYSYMAIINQFKQLFI